LDYNRQESLVQVSSHIKKLIRAGSMSQELTKEILRHYISLSGVIKDALVAVRSSATAEDLPTASFAGQQETFLNVQGETNVLLKIKDAWASLFDARAIFYRHEQNFDHFKVGIAIPVQKMVESEKSGVMFTIDPVSNDKTKIIVEAIYGLGEYIVGGKVTPDHYEVAKSDKKLLQKNIAKQEVCYKRSGQANREVKVARKDQENQKITDKQILKLAELGEQLEKHYYFPQDIEWAIEKNKIYIVQTRPVTTVKQGERGKGDKERSEAVNKMSDRVLPLLFKGEPASPGIISGPVSIIHSPSEIGKIKTGDILVAPQTNPDFVPAMKKAAAIITDKGGRTSHAAIVARELGIPAVVGTEKATQILKNNMVVTVNGMTGEIHKGGHFKKSESRFTNSEERVETVTKVYVNLAEPELAAEVASGHVDGIGLLRAEFMMAQIGTHPKKLIHDGKKNMFVDQLAKGMSAFCRNFGSRPVVYRASDFKTNEYRNLVGGKEHEPIEPNPMLGYRGAYRYIADPEVFTLELEAIRRVREDMGCTNLFLMIPFVRTVNELVLVKKIITEFGLHRSSTFRLWMMVEIPSNIILLHKFIECGIDGISIGSNDLTMLMLGTDRDNSEVAREFNELDESVLWGLEHAIKTACKYKITSSICGQAPSIYPTLVKKLIEWGITSISVTPDRMYQTRKLVHEAEKEIWQE
jgi:pyruvate,water dikinase